MQPAAPAIKPSASIREARPSMASPPETREWRIEDGDRTRAPVGFGSPTLRTLLNYPLTRIQRGWLEFADEAGGRFCEKLAGQMDWLFPVSANRLHGLQ